MPDVAGRHHKKTIRDHDPLTCTKDKRAAKQVKRRWAARRKTKHYRKQHDSQKRDRIAKK